MDSVSPEQATRFSQHALDRLALGNYEGAWPYLEANLDATNDPSPMLLRLQGVCVAGLQHFAAAVPLLEAALKGYRLAEDVAGEVAVSCDFASVLQRHGQPRRARVLSAWACDYADHINPDQRAWLLNVTASVVAFQGDFDQALGYLEQARSFANEQLARWIALHSASVLHGLGRTTAAADQLNLVQPPFPPGDLITAPLHAYTCAWQALLENDSARAYSFCWQASEQIADAGYPPLTAPVQATFGVIAREQGNLAEAEQILALARATFQEHGDVAGELGVRWHQALLLRQQGRDDAAHEQLNLLLTDMQHADYGTTLLWQPRPFAELCQWLLAQGYDHAHANWLLTNVLAPCTTMTASPMSNVLLDTLTKRESEVIALVVQGSSDEEIAEHLCISKRTVETHLHRIYSKLSVKNRAAAVCYLLGTVSDEEREYSA